MMTRTIRATAVFAAAALALGACKHDGASSGVAATGTDQPRTTSPAIGELLEGVPGNAAVVGFVDLAESPWSMVTAGWPLPLDDSARQSLDKELREYVARFLGLDVTKLQFAVGFASGPPPHVAVLVKTVAGALKMPATGEHEGGKLWKLGGEDRLTLAIRGDVMIVGEPGAVSDALETLAGKRKPITADNKALVDWLRKDTSGAVFALAAIKPKDLPLPPPVSGLERLIVTIRGRGITAAIDGDDAAVSWLQSTADQALAAMLAEVERAHAAAVAGNTNPLEGASTIITTAYARSFVARIKPRRSGNRLSASLDFGAAELGAAVIPMLGIVAAVAVPAFMDYTRRAKQAGSTNPTP